MILDRPPDGLFERHALDLLRPRHDGEQQCHDDRRSASRGSRGANP
jgi:hypothetical protein